MNCNISFFTHYFFVLSFRLSSFQFTSYFLSCSFFIKIFIGNIGGAESLFEQGLQTCFPGVYSSVFSSSTRGNNCTPIVVFNSNSGLLAIPTEVLSPSKVGFELPNTIDLEVIVGAHVLEDVNSNDNKTSIPNIIDDTFVIKQKDCSTPLSPKSDTISIYNPIQSHPMRASKIRQKDVAHLLLKFASFLTKSKGDNPNALIVYRRAIEVRSLDCKLNFMPLLQAMMCFAIICVPC